jgi:hypothetical protein
MTDENEFVALRDEMFRRIGRNLLNFQLLERQLKHLVSTARIRGPARELAEIVEKQRGRVARSTLGPVSSEFLESYHSGADEAEEDGGMNNASEATFSFSFRAEVEAADHVVLRNQMLALVTERNELVHGIFCRWDGTSVGSTREMLTHLDDQRERIKPVLEYVHSLTRTHDEAMRQSAEFFASPDFERAMELAWLSQSPIVRALTECSAKLARDDGWVELSKAAQVVQREIAGELKELRQRYGYNTLKRLMQATRLFELREEPTARGTRTIYRRAQT